MKIVEALSPDVYAKCEMCKDEEAEIVVILADYNKHNICNTCRIKCERKNRYKKMKKLDKREDGIYLNSQLYGPSIELIPRSAQIINSSTYRIDAVLPSDEEVIFFMTIETYKYNNFDQYMNKPIFLGLIAFQGPKKTRVNWRIIKD